MVGSRFFGVRSAWKRERVGHKIAGVDRSGSTPWLRHRGHRRLGGLARDLSTVI